jgi:PKD repeat protein
LVYGLLERFRSGYMRTLLIIKGFNRSFGGISALFIAGSITFSGKADPVSQDRRINWDPGVRGGIPSRTQVYTNFTVSATAAAIQSALNRCPSNQVVQLAAGTYNMSQNLTIPSGVTLRGAGMGTTILKGSSTFSGDSFITFDSNFNSSWSAPARNLVSPQKGATQITTATAHGWTVGDVVLIDMIEQPAGDPPIDNNGSLGDCAWCGRENGQRPVGQWVKITGVPSTTSATIDPPLYWSYSNSPQAVEMTGLTHFAGVESLTVDNLSSVARDTVTTFGAVNCWLYDVELKGSYRRAFWGYGALWFTMQKCKVVGGVPIGTDGASQYTSDRAYGPFLGPHFSAGLFVDNIMEKLTMGIAFEGAVAGNVYSYNFITNIWWEATGDFPRRFGPLMHGPHPFMNLIEGNWSGGRFRADEYWGTSSHFTLLRNRIIQVNRGSPSAQNWTIDVERRNWYYSFVGNLLGEVGVENHYELINGESAPYAGGPVAIWKIGYNSLGENGTLYDAGTLRTAIRFGNWSSRTNDASTGAGVVWHVDNVSNPSDRTVPNSYYLSGKPAWFGPLTWPPYDPLRPTANSHTNIPAGYRYTFGRDPNGVVNESPTVNVSANKTSGVAPLSVQFSATASDPEGSTLTFSWNFGDGTVSSAQNPAKTYNSEGSFTANVTVSDGTNSTKSADLVITVGNQPPVAIASATPNAGSTPLTVSFSSAGSSDPEGQTLTYLWDFGDGSSSTTANPSHVYSTAGTFSARLTVSDGNKSSVSQPETINAFVAGAGLVAAYGFDEGSGSAVTDSSGNNNSGTISAATRSSTGKFGGALVFNGTSSVVTVNDSPALDVGIFTLEAWVNPSALGASVRNVIYKDDGAYYLIASSPDVQAPAVGSSLFTGPLPGTSALPLNVWSHLAATYDGSTIRLYVNGQQVATRAQTGLVVPSSGLLMIGGNSNVAGKNFAGVIDELRIYNRALAASEIQADMNAPINNAQRPIPPQNVRVVAE